MDDKNIIRDWHQIAVELLFVDADLALQSIASTVEHGDKDEAPLVCSARSAYEAVLAKRKEVSLSASEATTLDYKLDRLRARLQSLGEPV
ncbi:MAG: hypothetical protein WCC14_15420 [Acidobacteriaceae bacterium]